ncbi:dipeptide epimerase [Hymenobacter busanensis]|uniref:Dipeptide epimerase n=1 Tax=Hymenobacter busanensis TaxID=2607656 RepID=A0A7L4ZWJ1_9BACT|nr:dipeptide epimerase [Hymenobacter busanensis]KAA9332447.1 dipeptide epimerase [Hymenobacter busanensis]QHJ07215.1 dipeptide epimerase [Hymenobacter busanensis]
MLHWSIEPRELPLRFTWKISRNASDAKTNLFVRVADASGRPAGWGEAAPNVRYGESPALLLQQFAALQPDLARVQSLPELTQVLDAAAPAHALRFALESAYVHREALRRGQSVPQLLGVSAPAASVPTAFTLPIMEPAAVPAFVQQHGLARFALIKIKVNQEGGADLLRAFTRELPGHPLLVDGNEAWRDADGLLRFVEEAQTIAGLNVQLLEQPLPAACADDYRYLHGRTPWPLIADESVTDTADFAAIAQQFHMVNMKLMKAGGYLNGVRLLREAQAHGLRTMVGCMVETSLGIWSALQVSALCEVCDLDGLLIVRDEPFGVVQEAAGELAPQAAVPELLGL